MAGIGTRILFSPEQEKHRKELTGLFLFHFLTRARSTHTLRLRLTEESGQTERKRSRVSFHGSIFSCFQHKWLAGRRKDRTGVFGCRCFLGQLCLLSVLETSSGSERVRPHGYPCFYLFSHRHNTRTLNFLLSSRCWVPQSPVLLGPRERL